MRSALEALGSVLVLATGCMAGEPAFLAVDGMWNFSEQFADAVHQVGCTGTGPLTLIQAAGPDGGTDPNTPGPTFTGAAGVDNQCTSLDGPFTYFGDVVISNGVLTGWPHSALSWDAAVNDADCRYEGTVSGDAVHGTDMSGALTCTLASAGVTFHFVGTWAARNWRSEWCAARRELPGCSVPEGGP
jgi:hypothetical protein